MFVAAGYSVLEAENAEQALQILQEHTEITVLFMHMSIAEPPQGLHLGHQIAKRWPHVTIIAVSGQARSNKIPDSASFHAKPYDPAAVLLQVAQATAGRAV